MFVDNVIKKLSAEMRTEQSITREFMAKGEKDAFNQFCTEDT